MRVVTHRLRSQAPYYAIFALLFFLGMSLARAEDTPELPAMPDEVSSAQIQGSLTGPDAKTLAAQQESGE